ncbi:hypothetical protein Tco_1351659 [Tanacetum coccineum]
MILTTNTLYPSRKIWRIRACTHQRPRRKQAQYVVSREDKYAALDIWHVNILEDIKHGPYSKKLQYAVVCDKEFYERLFIPYKEPEREFRSSRRHFKTLSLDELRSPDFNLFSDQEYSKEEVAETMAETMEQYISKTQADYGSGVARPKIKDKEVILFYNGLGIPARQILVSRGAIPSKTTADAKLYEHNSIILEERSRKNNANPSYQERRQSMEDTLSKFMSESAKRHEENFNLIKEIQASTDAAIRNQGASIKTLEIQIGQISKVLQERGFGNLPSSTKANLRDQVKSISTTIEADSCPIRHIGSS